MTNDIKKSSVKNNEIFEKNCLNDFSVLKRKDNYILIMAGGLGKRLKNLTRKLPKPMLNLDNKPILQHIIENFKLYGYNKFLISVNYKADIIEDYFKDGLDYSCHIKYLKEKIKLGTGGAIKLAEDYIKDDFFIINGDVYCTVNFNEVMKFHKNNKNDITIVSIKKQINIEYGVLNLKENSVLNIEEKPKYEYVISGGIYCLNPKVINLIPKDTYYEITDLFKIALKLKLKVQSYIIDDYWIDIGKIEDYKRIQNDIYTLKDK